MEYPVIYKNILSEAKKWKAVKQDKKFWEELIRLLSPHKIPVNNI
jgi:hypothetical protein